MNLDVAAEQLGISRKTLDDYSLQLRRAREYGFDFEKSRNEKMGFLRKFVKDKAAIMKKGKKIKKEDNDHKSESEKQPDTPAVPRKKNGNY